MLKPINFERFLKACQLAYSKSQLPPAHHKTGESIFVKDGHNWIQIKLSNLLYAQGQDNYVSIFEKDKRLLTRITLNELQNKLPADEFLRVHKSYIISLSKIEKIEPHQVIIEGNKIPVTKSSRDIILQMLNK